MTGLMDTNDAMVWAEEFVRIFKGHIVASSSDFDELNATLKDNAIYQFVDEGTMVGWIANAMANGESFGKARLPKEGPWHAFLHFYHLDKSNAAFHCSEVRFSPVTFRLAAWIFESADVTAILSDEFAEVHNHMGSYEEDKGR